MNVEEYWDYVVHNRNYEDDPGRLEEPRIRYALQHLHGWVLDLGCNDAFLRQPLEAKGCVYVGIEANRYALTVDGETRRVQGDVQNLPFQDAAFDSVFAGEVIEHVPDPDRMLDEVRRVLRLGGTLVLTTALYQGGPIGNEEHFREYRTEDIAFLIMRHEFFIQDRRIVEVYPGRNTNVLRAVPYE